MKKKGIGIQDSGVGEPPPPDAFFFQVTSNGNEKILGQIGLF